MSAEVEGWSSSGNGLLDVDGLGSGFTRGFTLFFCGENGLKLERGAVACTVRLFGRRLAWERLGVDGGAELAAALASFL